MEIISEQEMQAAIEKSLINNPRTKNLLELAKKKPKLDTNSNCKIFFRSLAETKKIIDELNFDCLVKKVCLPNQEGGFDWPADLATQVAQEYKNYLFRLCKAIFIHKSTSSTHMDFLKVHLFKSVQKNIPSQAVDIFWHTHILFTEKYHKDCQDLFGYYLHHSPNV